MYVCICKAVTDRQIRQAVELGARSLGDLQESLGVATGCGKCASCARAILREELQRTSDADFAFGAGAWTSDHRSTARVMTANIIQESGGCT